MSVAENSAGARVNGIDVEALADVIRQIEQDPSKGVVAFKVNTTWQGQTRSESTIDYYTIGGEKIPRHFNVIVDEPLELLGANTAPNPQEMLMTALNACITVGYVAGAAVRGIMLEKLEIETTGELDLRGFLSLDAAVKPGYEKIRYVVRIKGDGTPAQFQEIHETVIRTSPNYFNVSRPVEIEAELTVEIS